MEKRAIVQQLSMIQRHLWIERSLKILQKTIFIGVVLALFEVLLSFFIVIPFLLHKIGMTTCILFVAAIGYCLFQKPSIREAAKRFDQNGLDDRVQTALDYWDLDSEMVLMLRKETADLMKAQAGEIRKKRSRIFEKKVILSSVALLFFAAFMYSIPHDTRDLALKKEAEEEVLKDAKEEIKELLEEKEKNLTDKDLLKEIDELKKQVLTASDSMEIVEDLVDAEQKLYQDLKKLMEQRKNLSQLLEKQSSLQKALDQNNQTEFNKEWKDLLEKASEGDAAANELLEQLQMFSTQDLTADTTMEQMKEQLNKLDKQSVKSLEAMNVQQDLNNMVNDLQQQRLTAGLSNGTPTATINSSTSGSQSNGTSPSKNGSNTNPSNSPSGQGGNGSGSNSQSGNGSAGNGSNPGNGSSGTGSGQGTGGTGSGTGASSGSGGNGAGLGSGSRELTIPETIDSQSNQILDEGELSESGESTQTLTQQGPAVPGQIRNYEEVIGSYESILRENMNRQQLPESLEQTVQNYFSDIGD